MWGPGAILVLLSHLQIEKDATKYVLRKTKKDIIQLTKKDFKV